MATPAVLPCPVPTDGAVVGVGLEGGIGVPTGVASGIARTGGVGRGVASWGLVIAAAGVGARVGRAEPGWGVGKGARVSVGAVAGAGCPVAKAGFGGWLESPASGRSAWVATAGEGSAPGGDAVESPGYAPEPEALVTVDAGGSAEDSSAWLRW